jgi:hypothetical protein
MPRSHLALAAFALVSLFGTACGGGPTPEPVTPTPLATPPVDDAPTAEDVSFLEVLSGQPTDVKIDGKSAGKTPITGYKVSAGTHEVTFLFSEDNAQTITVTTEPNKGSTVKLDPVPNATGSMKGDDVRRGGGDGDKKDGDAPKKKPKKKDKDAK